MLIANVDLLRILNNHRRITSQIPQLSQHSQELPVVTIRESVRLVHRISFRLIR